MILFNLTKLGLSLVVLKNVVFCDDLLIIRNEIV